MTYQIDIERTRFVELRRRILEIHPDLDDQTLADTLEGATNLKEAVAARLDRVSAAELGAVAPAVRRSAAAAG